MPSHPYDNPIHTTSAEPQVSVQIVVPARNEEECIGRCLDSLVRQQGIAFAITVVNDGSHDRTRAIAESFAGVRVIDAPALPPGTTGKCNALIRGAEGATAEWLLFTDADTYHYPGSLAQTVAEAQDRGVDLLSYSPEQETGSFAEMALMPVVFADLVRTYPPQRVNDPNDPTVAANGQYLLVRRATYGKVGGHKTIANKILEDVELARLFKVSHYHIWFRQGMGVVRTRMYRSFPEMVSGWSKNLALLFRRPLWLAALRALEFVAIVGLTVAASFALVRGDDVAALGFLAATLLVTGLFLRRIRHAHFPRSASLAALFGLPLFAWLLLRSWWQVSVCGTVTWKGRTYDHSVQDSAAFSAPQRAGDSSITRNS